MSGSSPDQDAAVRAAARAGDLDRYLSALLAQPGVRGDLLALTAFAGEVGAVPFSVSEPMLGEIRLQWWLDALKAPHDARTGNPVADAFRDALVRRRLDASLAMQLVEARMADCYADPIVDEAAFAARLEASEGNAIRLWLQTTGGIVADETVRDAAAALGTTRTLLALPRHLGHGRVPLPLSWLGGLASDAQSFMESSNAAQVAAALDRARAFAIKELEAVRGALGGRRKWGTALLPLALIEPYLRAFCDVNHDPLRQVAEIYPLRRVWGLWRANASGRL